MKKPKIIPPTYLLLGLILIIIISLLFPSFRLIKYPYNLFGVVLVLIGIVLNQSSAKIFKRSETSHKFEPSKKLITLRAYKFTRNPMYLGMFLILIGISVLTKNVLSIISPIIFVWMINRKIIPYEEWKNEKAFGKEYLNYKNKVRRWI